MRERPHPGGLFSYVNDFVFDFFNIQESFKQERDISDLHFKKIILTAENGLRGQRREYKKAVEKVISLTQVKHDGALREGDGEDGEDGGEQKGTGWTWG